MSKLGSGRTAMFAATVATVGALLVGCSGPAVDPAPTMTPSEWVEQFCAAVVASKPPPDATPITVVDPADRDAVNQSLNTGIDALGAAIAKLEQIGRSPIKSGDKGLTSVKDAYQRIRAGYVAARDAIGGLAPTDTAGVTAALTAAQNETIAASENLGSGLDDSELRTAAADAPTCKANGLG